MEKVCKNCKHFRTDKDRYYTVANWPGSGHCERWYQSYIEKPETFQPNDCWVESDEGWANYVGPDFGCVLFEEKHENRT